MSLQFLNHVIETKGLLHSIERSAQVLMRYSFGRSRFAEMMGSLEKDLGAMGVRVTFCVTASLLESHQGFLKRFSGKGHEFAAHGYFHTNMKMKTLEEQRDMVKRSYGAFTRARMRVLGFRCPYLSYNASTLAALAKSPFVWTSNDIILWDEALENSRRSEGHMRKLEALYNTLSPETSISLPVRTGPLLEIPITAPDDEMLFERYRIKDSAAIKRIWTGIFNKVHSRGELFHLLFHPERFRYFEAPIKETVAVARAHSPGVWFATLDEITAWWQERLSCSWKTETVKGGLRFRLKAPSRATVLIKSTGKARQDGLVCGLYGKAEMKSIGGHSYFEGAEALGHVVHVSKRCSQGARQFLSDEGFIVSISEVPQKGALFIDGFERFAPRDRRLLLDLVESSEFPLLRLWRWPDGRQSAFTISSDVDSINIADFFKRLINF
ncbi:MAG TPA: polysaccharide deacetylase family protein [Thermodesulfobacteriota bacterium]